MPDPVTVLARLGIDPHGPHEIDVLRLTKQMKKAASLAPLRTMPGTASTSGRKGLTRPGTTAQ